MARWPEPVRPPLPVGLLNENDIDEILPLTIQYLDDPEDSEFDPALFGFVGAVRVALIECEELLSLARISRELAAEDGRSEPDYREWQRLGEELAARKVARQVINQLRQWIPEQRAFTAREDD